MNSYVENMQLERLATISMIGALYAAATLFSLLFLGGLAWGPIQFRVSEAFCVLALFTPDAILGLTLGCAVANGANILLGATGALGLLDVIFGSLATGLGALLVWRLRKHPLIALAGVVLSNALIVPLYMPALFSALGYETIPFTSISLQESWAFLYWIIALTIAIGETVVLYALGIPLYKGLAKSPLPALVQCGGALPRQRG